MQTAAMNHLTALRRRTLGATRRVGSTPFRPLRTLLWAAAVLLSFWALTRGALLIQHADRLVAGELPALMWTSLRVDLVSLG